MHVRSLFALVVAALLAGPAAAHAQAKRSSAKAAPSKGATTATTAGSLEKPSVDGWIGYESDDPLGGFQLRGDYVWPYRVLAPNVDLSFVGAVGLTRLSESVTTPAFAGVPAVTADTTAWMFKVIPTARFTYNFPQDRRFSVFGDAGLGLTYSSVSTDITGGGSSSDSSIGVTLRLGAGGFFRVDPRWQLGATVAYDPTSGDFGFDTWSILAGAKYTL